MTFYDDLVAAGREHAATRPRCSAASDRAVVTLDDPAKLNVLSAPLVLQLKAALVELVADPAIRAIVLTGADPGFSAGGDLRMMDDTPARSHRRRARPTSGAGSATSSAGSSG